MTTYKIKVSPR